MPPDESFVVAEAEPVLEEAPPARPHAWDIPYGEEEAAAAEAAAAEAAAEVAETADVPAAPIPDEAPVVDEALVAEEEPVAEEPPPTEETPVVETPPVAESAELVADITSEAVPEAAEVAGEPPSPEPAPRDGGSIDQAEMRRRIEETRARLKAKAFDAMMSGEAALLSRDSGDKPVPSGDVDLDAETDTAIDESLSQDEEY